MLYSTPVSITLLVILICYNQTVKNLSKKINLKNLSQWLKANNFSLNVTKIELIIFHPSSKKIDHNWKFKLDGKHLTSPNTVKYLGVLLDEYLIWSKKLNHITTKLNQAIGILSKIRDNTCLKIQTEGDGGMGIEDMELLGFLLYLWKFQTKESFTPRNSTKLCYTFWKF